MSRSQEEDLEKLLDQLEAEGFLQRATKHGHMPPIKPMKNRGKSSTEILQEERDER